MGNHAQDEKVREIFDALAFYRGLIVDLAEQTAGHQENWPYFRGRLLGLLGEKGLLGRFRIILERGASGSTEKSGYEHL